MKESQLKDSTIPHDDVIDNAKEYLKQRKQRDY